MRLWSIHPRYLDPAGLVALWRESLLALKVLENKTGGYRHHPQLARFRKEREPLEAIMRYLEIVYGESKNRGYAFDATKIRPSSFTGRIPVTDGQVAYEWRHFLAKVEKRNRAVHERYRDVVVPDVNPIFVVLPGEIEDWERVR